MEPVSQTRTRIQQPKRDKYAGLSRRTKRRKMAMDEDEGESGAVRAAVRSAKKAQRPTKIGLPEARPAIGKKAKAKSRDRGREKHKVARAKGVFDRDLGEKRKSASGGGGAREGARANKGDKIGGMGKKGPKSKGKGKR